MMGEKIQFGSWQIDFQVIFSKRKTLGITVLPGLQVLVRAPLDASMEKIREKVTKKAPWIIRQQSLFLSYHPLTSQKKFIGGESHLYLGRQYRLKIIPGESEKVKLKGQFLEVYTNDKSRVKELLSNWYLILSVKKLLEIATPFIDRFKKYNVEPSSFQLKEMPTRWGSCTAGGKIILNPELIKAPKGCIEYVIIHELCHLVIHNHSEKFIDLQTREMPDWIKWKQKLDRLLA
jgi:predicted metal-dependent hydrolase